MTTEASAQLKSVGPVQGGAAARHPALCPVRSGLFLSVRFHPLQDAFVLFGLHRSLF